MKRRDAHRLVCVVIGVMAAAVAVACSNSTSPHMGTPCPKYTGGSATPITLAGNYTLASFCEDTLPAFGPAQGFMGTLTMTHSASADSFQAVIQVPNQSPLALAGPYTIGHDTITVTLPQPYGTFTGTYAFALHPPDTLSVSGLLPGNTPVAIVFTK
ncbi:MAG TPA: hypothetical protein VJN39_03995 [Gemmatimonadales bacterium]|nr:hypothetical protein [Gemmatimonadales bacterium]